MPKTLKRFDYTVSKKFPSGEIVSITCGTSMEDDIDDTDDAREALFALVMRSTAADMITLRKKDKSYKSAWDSLNGAVKNEKKVDAAKQKLKDYE